MLRVKKNTCVHTHVADTLKCSLCMTLFHDKLHDYAQVSIKTPRNKWQDAKYLCKSPSNLTAVWTGSYILLLIVLWLAIATSHSSAYGVVKLFFFFFISCFFMDLIWIFCSYSTLYFFSCLTLMLFLLLILFFVSRYPYHNYKFDVATIFSLYWNPAYV